MQFQFIMTIMFRGNSLTGSCMPPLISTSPYSSIPVPVVHRGRDSLPGLPSRVGIPYPTLAANRESILVSPHRREVLSSPSFPTRQLSVSPPTPYSMEPFCYPPRSPHLLSSTEPTLEEEETSTSQPLDLSVQRTALGHTQVNGLPRLYFKH